jgi:3-dehydroquinate synthase
MQQVQVPLSERSYTIWIGTDRLTQMVSRLASSLTDWSHAVLIADEHVQEPVANVIGNYLLQANKRVSHIAIPSGEESKSIASLTSIWNQMQSQQADRKSIVIAIGGGVVGDLAGFAAASYMRGLRFVQVPTTLLSMVDSSVGGKTGINLPTAKNMIGAFWQPIDVWIDTQTLRTLPEREYRSGLAEVVKYGVILDADFFQYVETHADSLLARSPHAIQHIVARSCELKAHVVSQDERETTGLRAILNYGHTFGHAIEAKTAYGRFLHGEAIAIGMTMAGRLAVQLGMWNASCLERQSQLLSRLGLPIEFDDVPGHELVEAMMRDKKTEHGKINFILPTQLGHVKTAANIPLPEVLEAMKPHSQTK